MYGLPYIFFINNINRKIGHVETYINNRVK